MSINNISDEELDNLFRKGAESYDPPYDPEAWKAMEQKLESVDGKHSWWYKLFYPLVLLLSIYSIVAVVKLAHESDKVTKTVTENKLSEGRQQVSRNSAKINQLPLQQERPADVLTNRIPGTGPASAVTGNDGDVKAGKSRSITGKTIADLHRKRRAAETKTQAVPASENTDKQIVTPSTTNNNVQDHKPVESTQESERPAQPSLHSFQMLPDSAQALVAAHPGLNPDTDSSSLNREATNKSPFLSSLQVVVLVAPDVTTVKLRNPDAISANAGLILGVPVTNKISIQSGVVWANKVYGATPEDYAPTPDYWSGRKLPSLIDGVCKVLDIPLNISYRVFERDKNSIAIQAGLSSYIMLDEKYTYNYGSYSKTIEIANQNKHWFGVQNMSVSFNRKLSPVFSVGVEPFLKIPLTGVGAGQVKLTSAGIFFTAGYTVSLKK